MNEQIEELLKRIVGHRSTIVKIREGINEITKGTPTLEANNNITLFMHRMDYEMAQIALLNAKIDLLAYQEKQKEKIK